MAAEDEEEDDEGEEEEELDLGYVEEMEEIENEYMHLGFPHLGISWREYMSTCKMCMPIVIMDTPSSGPELEQLDHHHHFLGGGAAGLSLFSRSGYQPRPATEPESSSQSGLPQFHPMLAHRFEHSHHQPVGTATSYRSGLLAVDLQRSNIVQQMLTNISTSVGTEEVLSFNVGSGNPQRTSGKAACFLYWQVPAESY